MYAEQERQNSSTSKNDFWRLSNVKTLAIREAIKTTVQMEMDNIIMESDFREMIFSIMDKVVAPKCISILVDDIKYITRNINITTIKYITRNVNKNISVLVDDIKYIIRNIKNIKFSYYNRLLIF